MEDVFDPIHSRLTVQSHDGAPFERCCPEHGNPKETEFGNRKTWCAILISVLFHGALLSAPLSVKLARQPVCEEMQLLVARGGGPPSLPEEQSEEAVQVPEPPPLEPVITEKVIPKPPEVKPVKKKPIVKPTPTKPSPSPVEKPVENQAPNQTPGEVPSEGQAVASAGPGPPGQGSAARGPVESSFGASDGPRFLRRVLPRYPQLAREMGKEGTVLLRLTIDERGRLVEAIVERGAGSGFDEQALRAVKESTFSPARRDGRPVVCRASLPVKFILEGPDHD